MKPDFNGICYSIREFRDMAGLMQGELAELAGISQVYLSEIEKGRKKLTKEAAEKIASAFDDVLIDKNRNKNPKINSELLRASHIASFYPEDIQGKIKRLILEISEKEKQLDQFLLNEKYNEAENLENTANSINKSEPIENTIKENLDNIEINKEQLLGSSRMDKKNKKKPGNIYREKKM